MESSELVELAALIASHGPVLTLSPAKISRSSIDQYWIASKCRLERWSTGLKKLNHIDQQSLSDAQKNDAYSLIADILTSEVLTRVWMAVIKVYDQHHQTQDCEPIARSIYIGHIEARNRALALLLKSSTVDADDSIRLNRLRRRCERWTDLMIGRLCHLGDVSHCAPHPQRALDFADDLKHDRLSAVGQQSWDIMLASLRVAFVQRVNHHSQDTVSNTKIASSILACFQPELFDSLGTLQSLWQVRMTNASDDAQGMIDQLIEEENHLPDPSQHGQHSLKGPYFRGLSDRLSDE